MASPQMNAVISQTNFPGLKLQSRGKVRDIYASGDRLLIVATDRLSAFDVVLPTPIPDKGRVLTQLSLFWFEKLADIVPHHVISATNFTGELAPYAEALEGRSMLVRRTEPVPIECVVRGYISGSGWKDYQKTGAICGIPLPPGLRESDRLPEPIFTPSTKATTGHDENISFDETVSRIGKPLADRLRKTSLTLYKRAAEHAAERGIIIADTKFEFGLLGDELIWIDEALDARFFAILAVGGIRARAVRSLLLTSNLSATTSNESDGISNRRRPRCQRTSWPAQEISTEKHINASPATHSTERIGPCHAC